MNGLSCASCLRRLPTGDVRYCPYCGVNVRGHNTAKPAPPDWCDTSLEVVSRPPLGYVGSFTYRLTVELPEERVTVDFQTASRPDSEKMGYATDPALGRAVNELIDQMKRRGWAPGMGCVYPVQVSALRFFPLGHPVFQSRLGSR